MNNEFVFSRAYYGLLVAFISLYSCCGNDIEEIDYRQEMRSLVQEISSYAKQSNHQFLIVPQNGQELMTQNGNPDGEIDSDYIAAIDGTGREDLLYGYGSLDVATPTQETTWMLSFCQLSEKHGVEVLVIDYCYTPSKIDHSYQSNIGKGFVSFAAPVKELNVIPLYPSKPYNENNRDIVDLQNAGNFLYLINSENYLIKQQFIDAIAQTNYDVVIVDLFHNDEAYDTHDVDLLKLKKNGSKRLALCYISIGEAEDYRYYWQKEWGNNPPEWLESENPDWEGNYKVRYWNKEWKRILYGNSNAYLDKILAAGFDGVYLDLIDAFEYFETR